MTTFDVDVYTKKEFVPTKITLPAGSVSDEKIPAGANIDAAKLKRRVPFSVELFGPTTTITALTKTLTMIRGATGKVISITGHIDVQATGADRTVTIDLKKSTGGGAFATILTTTVNITNATAIRTAVNGAINTADLVVGDILQLVVTVAGAAAPRPRA